MFKIPNDCPFCEKKHFSKEAGRECKERYNAIARMRQIAEVGKVVFYLIENSEEPQYFPIARIIENEIDFGDKNFSLVNAEEAPYSVRSLWRAEDRGVASIWLKAEVISIKEAMERGWRVKNGRHWAVNASSEMQEEYDLIFRQLEIEPMTEKQKAIMLLSIRQKISPSVARDEIIANMIQTNSE